ncbi:MAG: MBL fold metallo-hydrolase [Halanaerobiales bacterium]
MKCEISVLASGSSGNSIFIKGNNIKVLIDAGLSGKEIERRLNKIGEDAENINAILVTHEHNDHINGAGVLSRRYDIPIYANQLTWEGATKKIGSVKEKNCRLFNNVFMLGDIGFEPFSISHDALDPVGFIVHVARKRIVIATDMGQITPTVREKLAAPDFMIIEANHDLDMLMNGSYPQSLKRRIRGKEGHLSNDDTASLLPEILEDNSPRILLAHLSQDNNDPRVALLTVKNNLEEYGFQVGKDLKLDCAFREKPTRKYIIG